MIGLAACQPVTLRRTEAPPTEAPYYAPEFDMSGLDGSAYQLSALRGQWVVINFWATWCAPCVEEMPALQAFADTDDANLVVLGVNMRETEAEIRAFADEHDIHFPLLIMPDDATLIAYSVIGLPQTFLVAPDGSLVYRSFGPIDFAALRQFIN